MDITLICLYGPNRDDPEFYSIIKELAEQYENPFSMICGDWNLVQDHEKDTYKGVFINTLVGGAGQNGGGGKKVLSCRRGGPKSFQQ